MLTLHWWRPQRFAVEGPHYELLAFDQMGCDELRARIAAMLGGGVEAAQLGIASSRFGPAFI